MLNRVLRKRFFSQPLARDVKNIVEAAARLHQCIWLDPSDLSTMYQDVGSSALAAVDGPVALVLDKSANLIKGGELVPNGVFNGLYGWFTGSGVNASSSGGVATVNLQGSISTTTANWFSSGVPVPNGDTRFFTVEFNARWISGGHLQVGVGYSVAKTFAPDPVLKKYKVIACGIAGLNLGSSSVPCSVNFGSTSPAVWEISNVSCKQLLGNHAFQPVGASSPVLKIDGNGRFYLFFDGVDDFLSLSNVDLSSSDKLSLVAACELLSSTGMQIIIESSAGYASNSGAFELSVNEITQGSIAFARRADTFNQYKYSVAKSVPRKCVIGGYFDFSLPSATNGVFLRESLDSAGMTSGGTSQSKSAFGNHTVYIGRRGGVSGAFSGGMYGLCLLGGVTDISKLNKIERYMARRMGVTL